MSKYFELLQDGKTLAFPSEDTLQFFADKMEWYNDQGLDHTFSEEFVIDFIMGKDVKSMHDMNFYNFPEYTGNPDIDLQNIQVYFNEVMEYFQYVDEPEYKAKNKYINMIHDTTETDNVLRTISYLKERKLSASENADKIENAIKNDKISKQQEYEIYADALIARKNRPKRKFYQIFEYFRRKKEDKALDRMEKHLKSLGVSQELLERTKGGYGCEHNQFKNYVSESVHDRIENFKNRVREGFAEYHIDASKKDERQEENYRYFEIIKNRTLDQILPIYNSVKFKHELDANKVRNEFEQKDFEQEEVYLNSFEKLTQNTLNMSKDDFDEVQAEKANVGVQIEVLIDKVPKQPLDDKIRYQRQQGIREEVIEENESEYGDSLDESMELY